jgi:23S rRNA pseudouridine1911/1915/1917 synthase
VDLRILYEDDRLVAVDKPAGIVVHPTYKHSGGTLLDALRARSAEWPPGMNPTVVGRLDKDTSGIVVFAKSREAHAALQRSLAADGEKDYLAIVQGSVEIERGTIELPLMIDPTDRRRVVVSPSGSPSVTQVERLASTGEVSVLRCRLITGRRHQIRVHLAARGWPLIGDVVYGARVPGFPRHALHAWRLSFTHPAGRGRVTVDAPIPAAFQALAVSAGVHLTIFKSITHVA